MLTGKMKKMMEEAQRLQEQLQRDLAELRVSASSGGGAVTATLNGQKELVDLEIDPAVVDPEEVEMLQDLVVAAVAEASRRVDEAVREKLGSMAGLPGLPG